MKDALKFEAMDSEVGTIKATTKARSMINIEKVLSKKLSEKLSKGGDMDELRTSMKFVQSINEAVEDVEDRLDLQKHTSKELLKVVDKLETTEKKEETTDDETKPKKH